MKAYIISFYQKEVSDKELIVFLEGQDAVLNLYNPLPNTVFVVSDMNATYLAEVLGEEFPDSSFIVAEYVPYNSDGLLDEDVWDFLNNPEGGEK